MLPLSIFNNASNGYLIGDSCVFGAEVFVIKSEGKGERFSMIKDPSDGTFTWEVQYFSGLTGEFYYSKVYLAGGHEWYICYKFQTLDIFFLVSIQEPEYLDSCFASF